MNFFENSELNFIIKTIMQQSDCSVRLLLLKKLHQNYVNDIYFNITQSDERRIVDCFVWECNNNGGYFNIAFLIEDVFNKYTVKYGFENLAKCLEDRKLMLDVAECLQLGCHYKEAISLYKKLIYNVNITEDELEHTIKMMSLLVDEPESMKYLSQKEYDLFQKYSV